MICVIYIYIYIYSIMLVYLSCHAIITDIIIKFNNFYYVNTITLQQVN